MTDRQAARFVRPTGLRPGDETLLSALPLFRNMAPEQFRPLLVDASVQCFARHATLFVQGEPARQFYVVLEGWVKLYRASADGQETVIAAFTRGESFAEAASFPDGVFPVSAEVVEKARLLVVPAASFTDQLHRNPALAINMLANMSQRLRDLVQQIEQRTVKSAAQRLSAFLLKLCPDGRGPAAIDLPTEKALVAARLGMQPETLSRALAKLRSVGVNTRERQVIVSDRTALSRLAEGGQGG